MLDIFAQKWNFHFQDRRTRNTFPRQQTISILNLFSCSNAIEPGTITSDEQQLAMLNVKCHPFSFLIPHIFFTFAICQHLPLKHVLTDWKHSGNPSAFVAAGIVTSFRVVPHLRQRIAWSTETNKLRGKKKKCFMLGWRTDSDHKLPSLFLSLFLSLSLSFPRRVRVTVITPIKLRTNRFFIKKKKRKEKRNTHTKHKPNQNKVK